MEPQNDNKISNVIGTHIPNWLLEQLQTRSKKGTQANRDNQNLQYLGNKTGWVRLVSSINIKSDDINYFSKLTGLTLTKAEDLAKNFVLYGGVSKYNKQGDRTNYTLRKGFKETYSLLGDQEVRDFGYRPMPGLSRVVIETQGRLGSIRGATIEFKVWDKSQLDVIDALYFKLGYTMFLEWGNTFYYESESSNLSATELFSLDPFKDNLTKEQIALNLGLKRRESKGNYDGMLGMVSNFSFSYNQEGGYDCVLKLVGLGALADSIKINQSATLGDQLKRTIEELNSVYRDIQTQKEAKEKAEAASLAASQKAAEEKVALDKLETSKQGKTSIFKSILGKQQVEKGLDENSILGSGTPILIEDSFFRNHAVPSSKIVSSQRTLDYDKRGEYNYIYGDLLYLTEPGIVLQGNTDYPRDISKIIQNLNLDSNYISTVVLKGQSISSLAESGLVANASQFSKKVIYYSTTNQVINSTYPKNYPYNFDIDLTFVEQNSSGVDVNYGNTKSTIASEFLKQILNEKKQDSIKINSYSLRISGNDRFAIFIKGDFSWGLNLTTKEKKFNTATGQTEQVSTPDKGSLKLPFIIMIEDSSLISNIVLNPKEAQTSEYIDYSYQQKKLADQNQGAARAENTSATSNTSANQTKPAVQYQSSLEATLRSIQIHSLIEAIKPTSKNIDENRKVAEINLADPKFAVPVFSDGIFKPYISNIIGKTLSDSDPIQKNIKYGFNSALLSNKGTIPPEVNYASLLKSYVLPYDVNQDTNEGSRLAHPVYIQLGLLMFILNHCCNLYDKKTATTTTPLLYIDYNPETNFCLSHPCHMTTNGMTFMIPFQGFFKDYKKLFYDNVLSGDSIVGTSENKKETTPLFNPEKEDTISGDIPKFKDEGKTDAYRGKIMNVLVNIDYIFDIIKQFFSQDQTNSVFLKAFVEQILSDMNKTLGNFNIFRFSYDDASNCLQIIDDQLVPGLEGEEIVPNNSQYDIPIYGRGSIARSLDLRTDISSKMANVLAISANADIQKKSANSTDGTSYGFINENYSDRYIPNRTENSDIEVSKDKIKLADENNDAIISSALRFNKNVKDFYSTYNPSTENIGHAMNYFIEKLSKNKLDGPTRAAAMIPVSINFTLDGISGFNMMQGFTISEKFLPYTYNLRNTSANGNSQITKSTQKVGFMVTGNVHTIENNEWTTAIKANMTYLKERGEFSGSLNTGLIKGATATFNAENAGSSNNNTNFVATNAEALAIVETYLERGKITPADFNALISAVGIEAGANQEERASVAAVILNRTRTGIQGGTTILGTLKKPSQFQAVTGTSANGNRARPEYIDGPSESKAANIYGAIKNYLQKVPKNYLYFTSNIDAAYGPETDISFKTKLLAKGGKVIGDTIFSTQA